MSLGDHIAIHWTGGVGMFALLEGQVFFGLLLVGLTQYVYTALRARRR